MLDSGPLPIGQAPLPEGSCELRRNKCVPWKSAPGMLAKGKFRMSSHTEILDGFPYVWDWPKVLCCLAKMQCRGGWPTEGLVSSYMRNREAGKTVLQCLVLYVPFYPWININCLPTVCQRIQGWRCRQPRRRFCVERAMIETAPRWEGPERDI